MAQRRAVVGPRGGASALLRRAAVATATVVAALLAVAPAPRAPPAGAFAMAASRNLKTRKLLSPVCFEVRYEREADAEKAAKMLDKTEYEGRRIRVTLNTASTPVTKVNVQGIKTRTHPLDVKKHFGSIGEVAFVGVMKDLLFGEVRFANADLAWKAKTELDGSELYGKRIRIELDCSTDRLNKVLVHGLSAAVMWQELMDHFKQVADVEHAVVHGGQVATIVYESTAGAQRAVKNLNRSQMQKYTPARLKVTYPWDGTGDTTEVKVRGLPDDVNPDKLRRHFKVAGKIRDIFIDEDKLPPEFYLPAGPLPDPRSFFGSGTPR